MQKQKRRCALIGRPPCKRWESIYLYRAIRVGYFTGVPFPGDRPGVEKVRAS